MLDPLFELLLPWATPDQTAWVHAGVRKLAHVTEYAILAVLVVRALSRPERSVVWIGSRALLLCAAWAALDEFHQSFVESRTGAVSDVLLDTLGAAIGIRTTAWWGAFGLSSDRRSRA